MNLTELISLFSRYARGVNNFNAVRMCGLAEGTNTATLKITTGITYNIYNLDVTKAATDNIAMTACTEQPISTFCYYLVSINQAGSVTVTKGTNDTYSLPATPSGSIPIGAFKVVTGGSATFTSGTTDLSAAGVTATFYDIDCGIATSLINQAQSHLERGITIRRNGREIGVSNWEYMLVRADATALSSGDTTATFPFSRFKSFAGNGITIVDGGGNTTRLEKRDIIPIGTTLQSRPTIISKLPNKETTWTMDVAPTMAFSLWPTCDQSYTLSAMIYQYSPLLDNVIYSTNWLTENAPDVLLFGALIEWASFNQLPDGRVMEWKQRYNDAVWSLYQSEVQGKYNGSYIYTKFRNPLNSSGGYSDILGSIDGGLLTEGGGGGLLLES